jgi:hypothetical protein
MLALGIKEKNLALDKLAIDRGGQRSLAEIMLTPPVDATGKYIPEKDLFKGLKGRQLLNQAMPMMYGLYRNGTIDREVAHDLLVSDALKEEMTPEKKAFLEKVYAGDAAGLDSDPQFDTMVLPDGSRPPMPPPRPRPPRSRAAPTAPPTPPPGP